jgi:hypothetical protein
MKILRLVDHLEAPYVLPIFVDGLWCLDRHVAVGPGVGAASKREQDELGWLCSPVSLLRGQVQAGAAVQRRIYG